MLELAEHDFCISARMRPTAVRHASIAPPISIRRSVGVEPGGSSNMRHPVLSRMVVMVMPAGPNTAAIASVCSSNLNVASRVFMSAPTMFAGPSASSGLVLRISARVASPMPGSRFNSATGAAGVAGAVGAAECSVGAATCSASAATGSAGTAACSAGTATCSAGAGAAAAAVAAASPVGGGTPSTSPLS